MSDIVALVIIDLNARRELGRLNYGNPLLTSSPNDPLLDAYHEALDLALYLRQELERRAQ